MILRIAAEYMENCYGLRIVHEDYYTEIDKTKIPKELFEKLSNWYGKYERYTIMLRQELEKVKREIELLDKEGMEILAEFRSLNLFDDIKKYQYFSLGQDKMLVDG